MGEYAVERLWRDAKLLEIGGGTLESHQKNMARELEGLSFAYSNQVMETARLPYFYLHS